MKTYWQGGIFEIIRSYEQEKDKKGRSIQDPVWPIRGICSNVSSQGSRLEQELDYRFEVYASHTLSLLKTCRQVIEWRFRP